MRGFLVKGSFLRTASRVPIKGLLFNGSCFKDSLLRSRFKDMVPSKVSKSSFEF